MAKTKRAYVPPRIELLSSLGMQKHRTVDISAADSGVDEIGDVAALLAEFGSPLYIVSEKSLRTLYRTFRRFHQSTGGKITFFPLFSPYHAAYSHFCFKRLFG